MSREESIEKTRIHVSVGVAASVIISIVAGVWLIATSVININHKLDGTVQRSEMQLWLDAAREANPQIKVPPFPRAHVANSKPSDRVIATINP